MAFVTVEGEVSRINRTGNGFGVKESREYQGKTFTKYWSVFPKDSVTVTIGDPVKVSGFLDAKVGEPRTGTDGVERRYVDLVVSNARVEFGEHRPKVEPQATGWGGSDDVPF